MSDFEFEDEPQGEGPDWQWDFAHPLEERGLAKLVKAGPSDKNAGTTLFVASTATPDRAMDVVAQSWRLRNFRACPTILDNHLSTRVVGHAVEVGVPKSGDDAGKLVIRVAWDLDNPDPSIRAVGHQHLSGVRRAGSVGFRAGKRTKRSDLPKDHPHYQEPIEMDFWWGKEKVAGWLYESNELLEFSSASIPMNPEALQRSLGLGPREDSRSADPGAVHDFRQWLAENKTLCVELLMPTLIERMHTDPEFRLLVRAVAESVPVPSPVPTPQPKPPGVFSRLLALVES